MLKPFIHLLAFFGKEFNEVRRQPRLVLSLILGPFLILLLFGVGYQGSRPQLRTILVVPPNYANDPRIKQLTQIIQTNFTLQGVETNENDAMAKLQNDQADLVEILPSDFEQRISQGQQVPLTFRYNQIDPTTEQWIQYLGYVETTQLNQIVLTGAARQAQGQAGDIQQTLGQVQSTLQALNTGLSAADRAQQQQSISQLSGAIGAVADNPALQAQASTDPQAAKTLNDLRQLRDDLNTIDQALGNGTINQQQARIQEASQRAASLQAEVNQFSNLPPEVIASPLTEKYQNQSTSLDLMTFYAPGVIALILQHIAVTLAALSLVRERLQGSTEFFAVTPVSMLQVLLGKYLAYTLFIGIIAAVLVALMLLLHIPFLGSVAVFAAIMALCIWASGGIGFLLSTWSNSDTQAIQLSMLVLLLSVFFSGFFLPLNTFRVPLRYIGYILPLTHGMPAFQNVMLKGSVPTSLESVALALIAVITFLLVVRLWGRQFRKLS